MCMVVVAACTPGQTQPQAAEGAARISCAIGEGSDFGPDCLVEKVAGEEGAEFVVRHPDGGFRRFRIAPDRSGMIAVDGADDALNRRTGAGMEVTVGADRYRFPADLNAGA